MVESSTVAYTLNFHVIWFLVKSSLTGIHTTPPYPYTVMISGHTNVPTWNAKNTFFYWKIYLISWVTLYRNCCINTLPSERSSVTGLTIWVASSSSSVTVP